MHVLQSIDVPTLIKLGFNSSNAATVAAAASMLQQLPGLAAAEIAELLYTAVVRHEANHALDFLREATTYRWRPVQLSAEELLPVMQQAVSLGVQTSESAESMFRSLASLHRVLPAGRFPAGAVASLSQMALEVGSHSRCFDWLESFPAFSNISAQQLMDLLKAVLLASESNYRALHALSHIQAFRNVDAAAATALFTSTLTKEAAAAQAEQKWPHLSLLCKSILHPGVAAARDSEEIMRWLLPALAAAVQAGMRDEARPLVWGVKNVFSTDKVTVLLQAALQLDETGAILDIALGPLSGYASLEAGQILQLLCCATPLLDHDVRRTLVYSKGWSCISAEDKLVHVLPLLLPRLDADKQRLQAASLTADTAATLADTASRLWSAEPDSCLAGCSCMAKLQAGSQVWRCTKSYFLTCEATQFSEVLLPLSGFAKLRIRTLRVLISIIISVEFLALVALMYGVVRVVLVFIASAAVA